MVTGIRGIVPNQCIRRILRDEWRVNILPNQSVERTGMSRSAQCEFQRHRRLIPVAHLGRSASGSR